MTSWWKAITKNTHNADWVNDLASVENSIGGEDTADVDAEDLIDYEFVLSKVIYQRVLTTKQFKYRKFQGRQSLFF